MIIPEIGTKVYHTIFGLGEILSIHGEEMLVQFEEDVKTLGFPSVFENLMSLVDDDQQVLMQRSIADGYHKLITEKESKKLENKVKKEARQIPMDIRKKERKWYTYQDWEHEFPNHVVMMKTGYMYEAHNKSAYAMNMALNYELFINAFGKVTTGGPDEAKIAKAFEDYNVSYIIIEFNEIIDGINADNPFEVFGIKD